MELGVNHPLTKSMHRIVDEIVSEWSAFLSFQYHIIAQKPYFGDYMASHQLHGERAPHMARFMRKVCSERENLLMLEIGSWSGESAVLWANVAKQSLQKKPYPQLSIVCVDPWASYPCLDENPHLLAMKKAASNDKIFSLFLHNIRSTNHSDVVIPLRTWSQVAAKLFRTEVFDVVYVDGDHAHTAVMLDLQNYAPLIAEGGYICGDDLELQMSEIDVDFARPRLNQDVMRDVRTGKPFHPGVTMAVGEFFGEVSAYDGFWAMQKIRGKWEGVTL